VSVLIRIVLYLLALGQNLSQVDKIAHPTSALCVNTIKISCVAKHSYAIAIHLTVPS